MKQFEKLLETALDVMKVGSPEKHNELLKKIEAIQSASYMNELTRIEDLTVCLSLSPEFCRALVTISVATTKPVMEYINGHSS